MEDPGPGPQPSQATIRSQPADPHPAEEIPMIAAGPFRWLLTLVAMVSPFAAATCGAAGRSSLQPEADTHVVYRHFL
jgi:hypothetical protein